MQAPSTDAVTWFFAADLERHAGNPALLTETESVSYAELAGRAQAVADRLAGPRRLVMLACANSVDTIVAYLGILRAGHVALLVAADSPGAVATMISAYAPDTVITADLAIEDRHPQPMHTLHPDLALLLSTSGTTGSPKLVRLSYENLQANAEAIAAYLRIRETDRGVTTLPLHYCYGLSVLHSHLLRGAAVIVTDHSVSDDAFWELLRARAGTSFAGVPYTFDLLDRLGFAGWRLPSLRYITQAGGRLDPERVRRYAELGREQGWDLFVMYGQTEATARMAYLPPHLATLHPQAIGIPIPGGSFRLAPVEPVDEAGAHELVYSGPNVMLGYATTPADLAAGRTVHELHTGDLARINDAGLYEIVGRRSRFLKLFGLRIDLQQIESTLAGRGYTAACTGTDDGLVVAVEGSGEDGARIADAVATEYGLPRHAVGVHVMGELPRLPSGKPDLAAIRALATEPAEPPAVRDKETAVRDLYARALGARTVRPSDTFIDLGGDSLSYVTTSIQLERLIGPLPPAWPSMPIRDLVAPARPSVRPVLDTSVLLRAVSIVFIVLTHLKLAVLPGGSHVMLCVAAYNFARFNLSAAVDRFGRARQILRTAWRIYLPSVAWIALALLTLDVYSPVNLVMANYLVGTDNSNAEWHYWFLETLLYYLIAASAVLLTPWGDRIERRFPFALPATLMLSGPAIRFLLDLTSPSQYNRATPILLFWIFAVGWAAARASAVWQRLLVSACVVATVPWFFLSQHRATIVTVGILLLVWVRTLPSHRWMNIAVGTIASASLYVYITHWQVASRLEQRGFSAVMVLIACFAVGIAYGEIVRRVSGRGLLRRFSGSARGSASAPETV